MRVNAEFLGPGSVSIVLPAYNEEGNIERAILQSLDVLLGITSRYEVIVIDDCSRDRTQEIATDLSHRRSGVRVLSNPRNLGLGGSMRAGFEASRGEFVFYTDSDLPIDMRDLQRAIPLMDRFDFVAGYRLNRDEGPRRYLYSWLYNRLIRCLFHISVRDVNFSFKLIRRAVLQRIELSSVGTFIDAELLAESVRTGFRIGELGVRYSPRMWGESTLASPRVIRGIIVELLAYRRARRRAGSRSSAEDA